MTIVGEPVTGIEYGDFMSLCQDLLGVSHAQLQKEKKIGATKTQISPGIISLAKLKAAFKEYPAPSSHPSQVYKFYLIYL